LMGDGDWFTELRCRAVRATTRRTGRALGSGGRVPPPLPIKSVWTVWIPDRSAPLHPTRSARCRARSVAVTTNRQSVCLFVPGWRPRPSVCVYLLASPSTSSLPPPPCVKTSQTAEAGDGDVMVQFNPILQPPQPRFLSFPERCQRF